MLTLSNPAFRFKIFVGDMTRAIEFYEAVFSLSLVGTPIDGFKIAFILRNDTATEASGPLAASDVYTKARFGKLTYFGIPDFDVIPNRGRQID